MAQFPKARTVPKGENPNGFRSVGPDKYANRDPTEKRTPNGGFGFFGGFSRDRDGDRWGQVERGQIDEQGEQHDF